MSHSAVSDLGGASVTAVEFADQSSTRLRPGPALWRASMTWPQTILIDPARAAERLTQRFSASWYCPFDARIPRREEEVFASAPAQFAGPGIDGRGVLDGRRHHGYRYRDRQLSGGASRCTAYDGTAEHAPNDRGTAHRAQHRTCLATMPTDTISTDSTAMNSLCSTS